MSTLDDIMAGINEGLRPEQRASLADVLAVRIEEVERRLASLVLSDPDRANLAGWVREMKAELASIVRVRQAVLDAMQVPAVLDAAQVRNFKNVMLAATLDAMQERESKAPFADV
jgi:hypothetical protein